MSKWRARHGEERNRVESDEPPKSDDGRGSDGVSGGNENKGSSRGDSDRGSGAGRRGDGKKRYPVRKRYLRFLWAGVSGCSAALFVQPMELIKVRMQMCSPRLLKRVRPTTPQVVQRIYRTEGLPGFYRGLSASLTRQATYTTTRFGIYAWLFELYTTDEGVRPNFGMKVVMGMVAGGCGAFVGTPSEVAFVRMTADEQLPMIDRRNYNNVFDAFTQIARHEGITALWRGTGPTIVRGIVVNSMQLGVYAEVKEQLTATRRIKNERSQQLFASVLAGIVTSLVSAPVDLAKTRIQCQQNMFGVSEYRSTLHALLKISREEGILAAWKGFTPFVLRQLPHTILIFVFFEEINRVFKEEFTLEKMLKFQLITAQDRKEAASIERRRQYEEERKKRIFNAKNRLIGVDYEALERQVTERRVREQQEKATGELYAQQQIRDAQVALAMERKEADERKKASQEIDEFRKLYQRTEDRREFDLYDPDGLKKALPARLKDDDPRLGISSAQKFEGEDLLSQARLHEQKEQTRSWLQQQMQERASAERELLTSEKTYQEAIATRDCRALELQKIEQVCRRRLNEAMSNFNQAMSEDHETRRRMRETQEQEADYAEMYNALTGDFLTENPDAAKSNFGPGRQIGFKYKGMSEEERLTIRRDQIRQAEENKIAKENKARLHKYWEDYTNQTNRELAMLDRSVRKKQMALNMEIAKKNMQLSKEQKEHKDYMDKVVYTNKPTAAFFNCFNTTTR